MVKRDTLFLDAYRKENKAVQYDVFPNGELLMVKPETDRVAVPPSSSTGSSYCVGAAREHGRLSPCDAWQTSSHCEFQFPGR